MLKERMTPEELAQLTGYSRQTINKWVRKEGWVTSLNQAYRVEKPGWCMLMSRSVNLSAMPNARPMK
jgi:uncharacterized protein YjcR